MLRKDATTNCVLTIHNRILWPVIILGKWLVTSNTPIHHHSRTYLFIYYSINCVILEGQKMSQII